MATSRSAGVCIIGAGSDFPIPEDMPDFLSHWEVIRYLESYADRFEVRAHIARTDVTDVAPVPDAAWQVTLGSGSADG
ncbi:MAG: hypothetical protein ABI794_18065 [Betaproteobacteria bacterium]